MRRTRLTVEWLESRDLLSTASPLFTVEPAVSAAPTGYTPSPIRQAYGFNQITFGNGSIQGDGSGQTIAIVDAYDDPAIASDLHQFDAAFGLPDPPSFVKVNQNGGSTLPAADSSWALEISLDVEWAHAMAPGANILLVEANTNQYADLLAAVQYAANQPGVSVVSLSWGGTEFASETAYDSTFTTPAGHQGVSFIAAAGDSGAPAIYPAVSPNILAVGGTTLQTSSGNWASETAWSDGGGGLSAFEARPVYQHGLVTQSTTQRTSPDVAYDANPDTGFAVYDSFTDSTAQPWTQLGGTSAGAPQWAALVAIANQGRVQGGLGTLDGPSQLLPAIYQLPSSDFHDITSGASSGSPSYAAGPGYDLVTGRGSPYADRLVAALASQTFAAPTSPPTSNPPPVSAPSTPALNPPPAPPDPFIQVARDAVFIVQGWQARNLALIFSALQDVQVQLGTYPSQYWSLVGAFYMDLRADLGM